MKQSLCQSILGAAALTLALAPQVARCQSMTYGTGVGNYALLNGDLLALYIDRFGDLAAPRQAPLPNKPGGVLNGMSKPFINPDGSVDTSQTTGTYAALFSDTDTVFSPSLQASIQAKKEYITLGVTAATEGFGIHTGAGTNFTPYTALTSPVITVSGGSIMNALTAESVSHDGSLLVDQTVTFNDNTSKNIATFSTTFTNSGVSNITNLRYVRGVNPNQDEGPGGSNSVQTDQAFGTATDKTAFVINSIGSFSNRQLGLGVRTTDGGAQGSTIFAVSGSTSENTIVTTPVSLLNGVNYFQLHATGNGADFVDRTNAFNSGTSADYKQYIQSGGATDPFINGTSMAAVTPAFTSFATDTSLVLLSPLLGDDGGTPGTLFPGDSATFTFEYYFDPVPEPGPIALLGSGALTAGAAALRRRRR